MDEKNEGDEDVEMGESLEEGEIRDQPGKVSSVCSLSTEHMEWWNSRRSRSIRVSSVTFDSSGLPKFREGERESDGRHGGDVEFHDLPSGMGMEG